MGFKELNLKKYYDSDIDDILNDFYIPVLSESISYKRLVGFFSSESFALTATGICSLLKKGGIIQLITSPKFQKEDIDIIEKTYKSTNQVAEEILLNELNDLETFFIEDHVKAFAWMLLNKKLEIKIAIPINNSGIPFEENLIRKRGMFHQKVGIIEDEEGNKLSFSGSKNETIYGLMYNIEEFKVFRNWIANESEYFMADESKFNKFWNHESPKTLIIDLPKAVENKLLELAPSNISELNIEKWYKKRDLKQIVLRDYQNMAVNNWIKNNYKGIFEMATGTGKTFTALEAINKVLINNNKIITIISVPYNYLVSQWIDNINKYNLKLEIIVANSTNPKWKQELSNKIIDINLDILKKIIIITSHNTLSSKSFIKIIKNSKVDKLLIVDEVHGIAATKRKIALLEDYNFRLGLSATPKRWFDEEGTSIIYEYFDDVVFSYPLEKAIGKYLVPYDYIPHFVELTNDEMDLYLEKTQNLVKTYYSIKDKDKKNEIYDLILINRQKIIKDAHNKIEMFENIIKKINKIEYCLIYCTPNQMDIIQNILNKYNIIQHKFTFREGIEKEEKYGGLSEREYILDKFRKGAYQALVAIRCLDEGFDVPPTKIAFILASSGNPRQYIQRRGRVLRPCEGKNKAIIHDFIVTPPSLGLSESFNIERKIIKKELLRYKEFSISADNAVECLRQIENIEKRYFGGIVGGY